MPPLSVAGRLLPVHFVLQPRVYVHMCSLLGSEQGWGRRCRAGFDVAASIAGRFAREALSCSLAIRSVGEWGGRLQPE
jgi:hypothetical protein